MTVPTLSATVPSGLIPVPTQMSTQHTSLSSVAENNTSYMDILRTSVSADVNSTSTTNVPLLALSTTQATSTSSGSSVSQKSYNTTNFVGSISTLPAMDSNFSTSAENVTAFSTVQETSTSSGFSVLHVTSDNTISTSTMSVNLTTNLVTSLSVPGITTSLPTTAIQGVSIISGLTSQKDNENTTVPVGSLSTMGATNVNFSTSSANLIVFSTMQVTSISSGSSALLNTTVYNTKPTGSVSTNVSTNFVTPVSITSIMTSQPTSTGSEVSLNSDLISQKAIHNNTSSVGSFTTVNTVNLNLSTSGTNETAFSTTQSTSVSSGRSTLQTTTAYNTKPTSSVSTNITTNFVTPVSITSITTSQPTSTRSEVSLNSDLISQKATQNNTSSVGSFTTVSAMNLNVSTSAANLIVSTTQSTSVSSGHSTLQSVPTNYSVTTFTPSTNVSEKLFTSATDKTASPSAAAIQSSTITSGSLTSQKVNNNSTSTTPIPTSLATTASSGVTVSSAASTTSVNTTAIFNIATTTQLPTSTTKMSTTITTVSTTSATRSTLLPAVQLFTYGKQVGDTEFLTKSFDAVSNFFKPEMGFPFGDTLYNSLYFTDNGQIIFPSTDNDIFNYTNPPVQGFSKGFKPPMIAAFWDDADLSSGSGRIYYKEYYTLTSSNDLIVQSVSSMIHNYTNNSLYSAKWTLKITWENVSAFPAAKLLAQTNTYQAVLTTDGSTSYVLLLYNDGEMKWEVTARKENNALIGFFSGDNHFINDDITKLPSAQRYRPDQYMITNSVVRGLRIYQLTNTIQKNYRLQCLQWYASEPSPSAWSKNSDCCPRTYQQGLLNGRYLNYFTGSYNSYTLRTTSSKSIASGIRCVYNQNQQFLEGWQERIHNVAFEMDPYIWCCKNVSKQIFCDKYAEKRPKVMCTNYIPPSISIAHGDPHITTIDGKSYTFNGLGDFILLNARDESTSFILEGRTNQTNGALATNFIAIVAQYTSNTTNKVQFIVDSDNTTQILLNGVNVSFSYSSELQTDFYNGTDLYIQKKDSINVTFNGKVSLSVSVSFGMINVVLYLPNDYMNKTNGLLGIWNGNPDDDFTMPNGTQIPASSSESDIYSYGLTWRSGNNTLFTTKMTYENSNFTPVFTQSFDSDPLWYGKVQTACGNNSQCIFDAFVTRKVDIGLQTRNMEFTFLKANSTLNSYPPAIMGNDTIQANISEQVIYKYYATGSQVYFATFTSSDLNITANGTLTWRPTSVNPFSANIVATDLSNNLSSIISPRFVVSDCGTNGISAWNDTTRVNDSSLYQPSCQCINGYVGSSCQSRANPCSSSSCYPNVTCSDSTGCGPCPAGLTGDGIHCSDMDECNTTNPCNSNATCANSIGSFSCTCNPGFTGNGTSCSDIDECSTLQICAINEVCTNTIGSYTCTCKPGYAGSGSSCIDINECNIQGICLNGSCRNTDGSYTCTCNSGYTQQGVSCVDIDECATGQNNCPMNTTCINTPGSFKCACNAGYSVSSLGCTPIVCYGYTCPSGYCNNGGTCTIKPNKNCMAECQCLGGFTGDRCTDTEYKFFPKPLPTTPRRKIKITLWQTIANLTSENNWNSTLTKAINETITFTMASLSMGTFEKNEIISVILLPENDSFAANIISTFMYNASSTIIRFLNDDLLLNVKSALKSSTGTSKRVERAISSSSISYNNSNATDAEQPLTIAQLAEYFNCTLDSGSSGYVLEYSADIGFQCVSPCAHGYCLNEATCQHQQSGPVCICRPVSMYSPFGTRCENLAVNLNGFFGILFGALAFLLLLILGIILAVFCCRRRKSGSHDFTDTFESMPTSKSSPLSPSTNIQVTTIQKDHNPYLISWNPVLQNVDTSVKSIIQRPSLKADKQDGSS